ncbi:hypothetical protein E4U30_006095 [Claviceps sp. LM220 group G6]|nr:hypothetical protein E4U32_003131 [Claviceps aff. humidiphila group G2b]KAG6089400.1 hypothetical protein E4U15_003033 [Claviceps sp. LM218 group G6]KAG6091982.1 hypothetical protein E4U30_006095 [Claviceps sp. LM220 group G6]KAG6103677.1 hypothetical protein E4U31_002639 [Claviceps sp. LM219 group G6]KAG6118741.1 hypothetical protein E4U14_006357 [Claviceps sp. LM454 group G7]
MPSSDPHTYNFALQKYILLQEQHEELSSHLEQIRPRQSSVTSVSTRSSSTSSDSSPQARRHSRCARARYSGWDFAAADPLDTILDEDTLYDISTKEQHLSDVNESIKRALTELVNCDAVRSNDAMRMWAQTRLMETEKELRSGRRRRSTPGKE